MIFLAGNKIMPMHLKQPGFRYSACEQFKNIKERIQKFTGTRKSRYIFQNE